MAIEKRNGNLYYTQSTRVHGKVKREYLGSGIWGLLAHLIDKQKRYEQQVQQRLRQERWREERHDTNALNEAVRTVCEEADAMFHAAMDAAGYHQHGRSEWRKKRQEKLDHD
ncbi:MAG: hypothetical protein ACRYFS_20980 [Janthinobacterium lividum]